MSCHNLLKCFAYKAFIVTGLVSSGPLSAAMNPHDLSAAIDMGNISAIMSALDDGGDGFDSLNYQGETMIHAALRKGDLGIFKILIEAGADINKPNKEGMTPLHMAAQDGNLDAIKILIDFGVNINEINKENGKTAICYAIDPIMLNINYNAIHLLLAAGADINVTLKDGRSFIADFLNKKVLQPWQNSSLLLDFIFSIESLKKEPLIPFIINLSDEMFQRVIDSGLDVNMADDKGRTLLYWTVRESQKSKLAILLDRKANVNQPNIHGRTPLHEAAFVGNADIIQMLCKNGAKKNVYNSYGNTPLHEALGTGWDFSAIQNLINAGIDMNISNKYTGNTILHDVCLMGGGNLLHPLLELGTVDVNKPNKKGNTALHFIADKAHAMVIQDLIQAGAKINAMNNDKKTPLDIAIEKAETSGQDSHGLQVLQSLNAKRGEELSVDSSVSNTENDEEKK